MLKRPSKAIIIGLDGAIVPRLYRFCKEGYLPTINRIFMEEGVWARNCLVPMPAFTSPNWSAIATGAWPSTIEITDFNIHVPGDELNVTHRGLFSDDVHAETLYESMAKSGKKSILLNYPCTWPPKMSENVIVIGGAFIQLNYWSRKVPLVGGKVEGAEGSTLEAPTSVAYSNLRLYSTQEYSGSTVIKFQETNDWKNLDSLGTVIAAEMPLKFGKDSLYKIEPVTWHILLQDEKSIICENKDPLTAMCTLTEGQWSPPITKEFQTEKGPKKAVFRVKLLELSPNADKFRLLLSNIAATDGWSYPASIAAEIESKEGLPGPGMPWSRYELGWFDIDTAVELANMETAFLGDAANYLLNNKKWNLFMMHAHAIDLMYHGTINSLNDPDPVLREPFEEAELATYQSIDEMCAKIFSCADDNTIMAIISDHGSNPAGENFNINSVLEQKGLLSRDGKGRVDWSRTKAIGEGSSHIWINMKGRDPHGIVEQGKEYSEIQKTIIKCLYEYNDLKSGEKPIVLAMKREDARMIGMHGNYIGDVIYGLQGGFGAQHAGQVPTAQYGIGDMHGLFALSGTNIKKGVELERTVWNLDLVPTICHLTRWPVPKQTEGAVIYQALVDTSIR